MTEKLGEFGPMLVAFVLFPLIASPLRSLPQRRFWPSIAILSILICFVCGALTISRHTQIILTPSIFDHSMPLACALFIGYFGLILGSYWALRRARSKRSSPWFAYLAPLTTLLIWREFLPKFGHIDRDGTVAIALGVSYGSFKLCHLVSEVLNEVVPMPTLPQYLAFAFYPPLIFVGPIQQYSSFYSSLTEPGKFPVNFNRATLRILVGIVKFMFLSAVLAEFGYGLAFLGDGHRHSAFDLALAVVIYPLYIFCNFSGLCDIAIGVSGLMGIHVIENFDRPFSSRNFQDFWTKWHISLSTWMRVMVFTPFVKKFSRKAGPAKMANVVAEGMMLSFVLIGLWHGVSLNFLLYGISQGVGVVAVHTWNSHLRKRLGPDRYLKFRSHKGVEWVGVGATYLYFALTLILFANTMDQIQRIFAHID